MITYDRFLRSYVVRKASDVKILHPMHPTFELPRHVILHVLDNLAVTSDNYVVTPPLSAPYMIWPPKKKIFIHNLQLNEPTDNMQMHYALKRVRITKSNITKALTKFRQNILPNGKVVAKLSNLKFNTTEQLIVNHNNLFRYRTATRKERLDLTQALWCDVFNFLLEFPDGKQHYLYLPIPHQTYQSSEIHNALKQFSIQTVKHLESEYYLFLLHFLQWLNPMTKSTIFSQIPVQQYDNINLIFCTNTKYVIYNLALLKELSKKNKMIWKQVLLQLNALAQDATSEELSTTEVTEEKEQDVEEIKVEPIKDDIILPKINSHTVSNVSRFTGNALSVKEHQKAQQALVKTQLQQGVDLIKNNDSLTPQQKNSMIKIAQESLQTEFEGKSLEEWITEPTNTDIRAQHVEQLDEQVPDKSMLKSRITNFDDTYVDSILKADLVKVLTSFQASGYFVQNIKSEEKTDALNRTVEYSVKFLDKNRKSHTVKFTFPVVKNGKFHINGVNKQIKKQRINLPIVKTSPTRVSLTSNYNKLLIERSPMQRHNFLKFISKFLEQCDLKLNYTAIKLPNSAFPHEYYELASKYETVSGHGIFWSFLYDTRFTYTAKRCSLSEATLQKLEETYGICIGVANKNISFITPYGNLVLYNPTTKEPEYTEILDYVSKVSNVIPKRSSVEHCYAHILNANIPVAFLLCYKFGLDHMLKYTKADYVFVPSRQSFEDVPVSAVKLRFQNGTLCIKRTNKTAFLIFAGLQQYNLKSYNTQDLNHTDPYYDLLEQKKISVNYLLGIDNFFNLFMDPVTIEILRDMHEPTNFKDLLIRAVSLLITSDYIEAASTAVSRVRSYEMMNAIMYNEVARSISNFNVKHVGVTSISINPYSVLQRIATSQLTENESTINPIHQMKEIASISHLGDGGRSEETFQIPDRRFTEDSIGVLSEASVDSGRVGINASLSVDPNLKTVRGLATGISPDKVEPAELLSVTALLFPGSTNDDGKRTCFLNIQSSHVVPSKDTQVYPICTGFERVMSHMVTSPFSYVAKEDGKVLSIDKDLHVAKIQLKDKTIEIIQYGKVLGKNSGGGTYIFHNFVPNELKPGKTIKKGDVLFYNPDFFQVDPYSKQVDFKLGTIGYVALADDELTLEDGSAISEDLSKKLGFSFTNMREVVVTKNVNVHDIVKMNQHVRNRDPLLVFDESGLPDSIQSGDDEDLKEMLETLNRSSPKAKHDGTIMKIKVYYKCPKSEMSSSLRRAINTIEKTDKAVAQFAKGSTNEHEYPEPKAITTTDKVGIVTLDENTVIFRFYIEHSANVYAGSKVIYGSSLKSVAGLVLPEINTADGIKVDAFMSERSFTARMVYGPKLVGIAAILMEKMTDHIIEIWDE